MLISFFVFNKVVGLPELYQAFGLPTQPKLVGFLIFQVYQTNKVHLLMDGSGRDFCNELTIPCS
jgi:hypothetical protein